MNHNINIDMQIDKNKPCNTQIKRIRQQSKIPPRSMRKLPQSRPIKLPPPHNKPCNSKKKRVRGGVKARERKKTPFPERKEVGSSRSLGCDSMVAGSTCGGG